MALRSGTNSAARLSCSCRRQVRPSKSGCPNVLVPTRTQVARTSLRCPEGDARNDAGWRRGGFGAALEASRSGSPHPRPTQGASPVPGGGLCRRRPAPDSRQAHEGCLGTPDPHPVPTHRRYTGGTLLLGADPPPPAQGHLPSPRIIGVGSNCDKAPNDLRLRITAATTGARLLREARAGTCRERPRRPRSRSCVRRRRFRRRRGAHRPRCRRRHRPASG